LNPIGTHVPKLGYKALAQEGREDHYIWWWKIIWKLKFPPKYRIFMWPSLYNKALTWDVLHKRNFIRLGWRCQCHQVEDSIVHLMLECPYSKEVWKEVERLIGIGNV